jgi:hypothetical protein
MRLDPYPRWPADDKQTTRKLTDLFRALALQVNSLSEGRLSATYSALAAVPTAGKYAAGDFVRNSVPVVTGTAPNTYVVWGWVCTVGGEPGTFEAINIPTGTFGPGLLALDDLSDVVITAPTNGQVLKYVGGEWINDTVSGGGGGGDSYFPSGF